MTTKRPCRLCGKPITGHNASKARRCMVCRVAADMRTWQYTADPYAVVLYRDDEAVWAARPEALR